MDLKHEICPWVNEWFQTTFTCPLFRVKSLGIGAQNLKNNLLKRKKDHFNLLDL